MPAAARVGDMVKQDSPHCHAPIHPPAPVPTPSAHPNAVEKLELISEEELPWTLRLHDRSFMEYLVHMIIVQKNQLPEQR